jgi:hypothetical protein
VIASGNLNDRKSSLHAQSRTLLSNGLVPPSIWKADADVPLIQLRTLISNTMPIRTIDWPQEVRVYRHTLQNFDRSPLELFTLDAQSGKAGSNNTGYYLSFLCSCPKSARIYQSPPTRPTRSSSMTGWSMWAPLRIASGIRSIARTFSNSPLLVSVPLLQWA